MKNSEFRIQNILVLFFAFYILHSTFYIPAVFALDSTSSAVKAASASATEDSIKQKIEAIKKEIASKAAALKQDVNKKLENKVFTGQILEVTDSKIIITTVKDGEKNTPENLAIITNEYTELSNTQKTAKKTKPSLKDFSASNYIIALGDIDDRGNLTAKKVIKIDRPPLPKIITWGQVTKEGSAEFSITTKDHLKIDYSVSSATSYQLGNEDAKFEDVKLNRFLIVTNSTEKDNLKQALYVYIIPQGLEEVKSKTASPSASLPASGAKPKTSPSPTARSR